MTGDEVFKCAVNGGQADAIRREAAVLRHLQAHGGMDVDIPRVTWEADDGSAYGMTRLHAEPLSHALLAGLGDEAAGRLGAALGRFNACMVRVLDADTRLQMGVPPVAERGAAWQITPDHLTDALSTGRAKAALGHEAWTTAVRLLDYAQRAYDPQKIEARVLPVHADMHGQNILYNRETGRLAVIDIGGGDTSRVEHAFCVLRRHFTPQFTSAVLASFSSDSGCRVHDSDIEVYYAMNALRHSILYPDAGLGIFRQECCPSLLAALNDLEKTDGVAKPYQSMDVRPLRCR